MECLREATVFSTVVEASCQTVVGQDVCEILVVQSVDIADGISWLAPKLFCSMVTVLDQKSAVVDGLIDHVAGCVPFGKMRHGARDIAASIRSEII